MTTRTPRHSAMVDFPQHKQRLYVVLEEDHEKIVQERDQLREEVEELRKDAVRRREQRGYSPSAADCTEADAELSKNG